MGARSSPADDSRVPTRSKSSSPTTPEPSEENRKSLPEVVTRDRWLVARRELLAREGGCQSCSAGADEISPGLLQHLHARDTTMVVVARAPLAKIEAYRARRGWTFPWYSSHGSDFNYDFHVTLDESVAPAEYSYRTLAELEQASPPGQVIEQPMEGPGQSCFLRDGDAVFHTYSAYARGTEMVGGSYYYLDQTALGRQEDWEEPKGRVASARDANPNFST